MQHLQWLKLTLAPGTKQPEAPDFVQSVLPHRDGSSVFSGLQQGSQSLLKRYKVLTSAGLVLHKVLQSSRCALPHLSEARHSRSESSKQGKVSKCASYVLTGLHNSCWLRRMTHCPVIPVHPSLQAFIPPGTGRRHPASNFKAQCRGTIG